MLLSLKELNVVVFFKHNLLFITFVLYTVLSSKCFKVVIDSQISSNIKNLQEISDYLKMAFNQTPFCKRSMYTSKVKSIKKGDIIGYFLTLRGKSATNIIDLLFKNGYIVKNNKYEQLNYFFVEVKDASKLFLKNNKTLNIISLDVRIYIILPGNRIYRRKRRMVKISNHTRENQKLKKNGILDNLYKIYQ